MAFRDTFARSEVGSLQASSPNVVAPAPRRAHRADRSPRRLRPNAASLVSCHHFAAPSRQPPAKRYRPALAASRWRVRPIGSRAGSCACSPAEGCHPPRARRAQTSHSSEQPSACSTSDDAQPRLVALRHQLCRTGPWITKAKGDRRKAGSGRRYDGAGRALADGDQRQIGLVAARHEIVDHDGALRADEPVVQPNRVIADVSVLSSGKHRETRTRRRARANRPCLYLWNSHQ